VVDLAKMEIEAPAPSAEIPRVKGRPGSRRCESDGFGDRVFEGRIERINPAADQGSRSITLYVSLPNRDGVLKGGMFAKASSFSTSPRRRPCVPAAAVREEAARTTSSPSRMGRSLAARVTLGLREKASWRFAAVLEKGVPVVRARIGDLKPGVPGGAQDLVRRQGRRFGVTEGRRHVDHQDQHQPARLRHHGHGGALCVLGLFSYNALRVERMPDITVPFVFIQVNYPGSSPDGVENDITKPIEEVVNTVNGVKVIRSNTWEGRSETYIEFRLETDMSRAVQDVRDKIALIRPGFPRDAKDPLILRGDFDNAQAGRAARGDVAHADAARAHHDDRPDHREGFPEGARRRARCRPPAASLARCSSTSSPRR
jgi:hypothetical protein